MPQEETRPSGSRVSQITMNRLVCPAGGWGAVGGGGRVSQITMNRLVCPAGGWGGPLGALVAGGQYGSGEA